MSIETVEITSPGSFSVVEIRQGPAGTGGGGSNSVTSATTSDGTANLSISNVTTATAEVTGTLTANHIHGNLAGNVYAHVRAGEALAKGDPVYVSGSHGSGSTLIAIVSKADASNAAKMPAVGIMDADLANNATGHMVIVGTITELATNAYSINAELYVAAGGGMTATPPTARAQPVARVERSNLNNGAILVKVNGLSASDATASTLVRRTSEGTISVNGLIATGGIEFNGNDAEDSMTFNQVYYAYGPGAASAHRFALNGGAATGDALFTAASASAARTTLELGNLATLNGPLAVASGGTGTTNGSITGTGALTFTAGGSNQNINLTPSGTGLINITGNSGNTVIPVFRATNNYSGGTVPGYVNTFECLAPNLSAGNAVYIPLGVSTTTNNRASIVFYYAASGSSNNYLSFGNFFGATGVLAAFPNGGVAIAASGTPINPGAGCLSVSGNVGIGTTSPSALLDVNSNTVRVRTARTPASATAAGNAGDICWDANYIYVCVATNTWKRTAISTWP